jgi:hypothetical protein
MVRIQTWIHKKNVSVRVASELVVSTIEWRGSAVAGPAIVGSAIDSAASWRGSIAHSWRGSTIWVIVRNYLSSMKAKVANEVANRRNECWSGKWWKCTLGPGSQYEIVHGLWSSYLANGVINPTGIWRLDRKWKGRTLWKVYSSIRSIFRRAEIEGEEGSYEDHLSCLEDLQE